MLRSGVVSQRTQTLVQLSDELVGQLDRRAAAAGTSRSALIRNLLEAGLGDERSADVSRQIVAGYERVPQQAAADAWGDLNEWSQVNGRRNRAALATEENERWQ